MVEFLWERMDYATFCLSAFCLSAFCDLGDRYSGRDPDGNGRTN
jgi:hypothetical protein